jgi:hypothetical protein
MILKNDKFAIVGNNFIKTHLGHTLYNYQTQITSAILNPNYKKISIRASTRAGKSFTIALTAIVYASIYSKTSIGIIAPSKDKTKIIMNYILEALANSDLESVIDLDVMNLTKIKRLKKEVSKNKVTFQNGSYIQVLTADIKNKGFSAMGSAFDVNIIDETAELPATVWSKIYRMLLESQHAKIVECGNPWFLNHFYEHSFDPTWLVIKIDYKMCVKEGRFSQEDVEDMRKEFSEVDFRVLLEAEFPKEIDTSLFKYDDLVKAKRPAPKIKKKPTKILAIDVARMGNDFTVMYELDLYDSLYIVREKTKYSKKELTKTAGKIIEKLKSKTFDIIRMDSTGLGIGLDDMLHEYIENNNLDTKLESIIFSEKADDQRNLNRKSDIFFNLSKVFSENQIIIPEDDTELFLQLRKMLYEYTSNAKRKIDNNQEKSPDCADALAIGCYTSHKDDVIIDFGD